MALPLPLGPAGASNQGEDLNIAFLWLRDTETQAESGTVTDVCEGPCSELTPWGYWTFRWV